MAATITTYLAGAWTWLSATFATGGVSALIAAAGVGVLQVASWGLAVAGAVANGVMWLFGSGILWSTIQSIGLAVWLAILKGGMLLLAVATTVGNAALGFLGIGIAGVTTEVIIAEAVTGTWVIALGLLAAGILVVVSALGVMAMAMVTVLVVAGAIAIAIGIVVVAAFKLLVSVATTAFAWIAEKAVSAWTWIAGTAASAFTGLVSGATAAALAVGEQFMALGSNLAAIGGTIGDSIGTGNIEDAFNVAWAAIKLGWVQTTNFLGETWTTITNWLADTFDSIWTGIVNTAVAAWSHFMHGLQTGWIEVIRLARLAAHYADPTIWGEAAAEERERINAEADAGRARIADERDTTVADADARVAAAQERAALRQQLLEAQQSGNAEAEAAAQAELSLQQFLAQEAALDTWLNQQRLGTLLNSDVSGSGARSRGDLATGTFFADIARGTFGGGQSGAERLAEEGNRQRDRMIQLMERVARAAETGAAFA